MNSAIASNINGVNNRQVASGSHCSLLLSSIDFSLSETRTNFSVPSSQGRYLIQLSGKEGLVRRDSNANMTDEDYISLNGSREKSPVEESLIPVARTQLYSGPIEVEWRQTHKIGAGLDNMGNTCFMNTVIQCLTYCPPLANYLLHDNEHSAKCSTSGFCMMCLLQKHVRRAIGKTGQVIKPADIYQRLKLIAKHFQYGRQEDAHEFLRYVIDHLWKACLPQTNGLHKLDAATKETTVINKIFGGYHRSQVICLKCKQQSNTFDYFMDFMLDIKQSIVSLEKALEKFTQSELLQQENCYKCPKCKMKVEARKRFSVYRAPTVATFQLKRFDYNRSFGGKITKQITYPETLDLRPYMSETKGDRVLYQLNAVLVHSGASCNSGHYYCYIKNSNGMWYLMDDSRVTHVGIQQVLNQSAYVLFYIKKGNAQRSHFKNCVDNKNSYLKGTLSNSHFSKESEHNSTKLSSYAEKVSPFASSKFGSPKLGYPVPNREKISFGFRNGPLLASPKSQVTPPESPQAPPNRAYEPSSPASSRGRLVPYGGDSSESSDAGESNSLHKKPAKIQEGKPFTKSSPSDSHRSRPPLEVKTRLSRSFFQSSPAPKVSATSPWIVTDAPPTPCSSSNSSGVNSTTNWQVIEAKSSDSHQVVNSVERSLPADDLGVSPVKKFSVFQKGPSSQNCNFRSQFFNDGPSSQGEATVSPAKRKPSDSCTKISTDSFLAGLGDSPLPKKIKYSESLPLLSPAAVQKKHCDRTAPLNGLHNPNSSTLNGESRLSKVLVKHRDNFFSESSQLNEKGRLAISDDGKNASLYGTEVGTWRREDPHYDRLSGISAHENRRVFNSYDLEFDQGKVRKAKARDRYQYFHHKNPFQKHNDRYRAKHNGKFYSHHHNHKKYDPHPNWKSHRHGDHHHQRYHHHRRF